MSEFHFPSISWEWIDGIWPNFAYALILTRSRLGLLSIDFRKFITELWPVIDVRISFLLNILTTNRWNLTKICICIDINKIKVGIVTRQFSQIYNSVIARDLCQNFVSTQYLENDWWNWPNLAYALILTTSRLGLLRVNFRKFITEHLCRGVYSFCLSVCPFVCTYVR